jgi:hypothetical protein
VTMAKVSDGSHEDGGKRSQECSECHELVLHTAVREGVHKIWHILTTWLVSRRPASPVREVAGHQKIC